MRSASSCSECGSTRKSSSSKDLDVLNLPVSLATLARLRDLLNTNEPPETAEAAFLRSAVSQTDARLALLGAEISQLRDLLRGLEEEHASLSRYRAQNSDILSPLRRIPAEVLGKIFLWALPRTSDASERKKFQITDSPWIFTHVNRRWRAIAISNPSLWSRVVISYHSGLNPSRLYPLSMVQTHIARAQKLKIHFYGCQKSDPQPQMNIFRCLSEHAFRWEEVSLRMTSSLVPLLAGLRDNIPLLRRLQIKWDGRKSQINAASIECFGTASALVDVSIQNTYRLVNVFLPTRQLTTYQLDAPWEIHRTLLKLARHLVQAHIDLSFDDDNRPDTQQIIDLFHLQRLFASHTKVLNYIRAPALEEIALMDAETQPDCLDDFDSFLVRSGCSLRKFAIQGLPTTEIITDFLHKCPSIVELAIVPRPDDDTIPVAAYDAANDLLTLLTVIGNTPVYPQLSGIHFGCTHGTLDYSLFLQMVESRWKAKECALKHSTLLTKSEGPNVSMLGRLRSLRQDGLDLVLSHGDLKAVKPVNAWFYGQT